MASGIAARFILWIPPEFEMQLLATDGNAPTLKKDAFRSPSL
jgi:hypothetical protein